MKITTFIRTSRVVFFAWSSPSAVLWMLERCPESGETWHFPQITHQYFRGFSNFCSKTLLWFYLMQSTS